MAAPSNEFSAVEVRRPSIESIVDMSPKARCPLGSVTNPRPIDLLDISSAVKAPGAFETVVINTSRWPTFSFVQQVDSLTADEHLVVRWIDVNHQRASVDLTRKVLHETDSKPQLIVILEKGRKGHFQ